MARAVVDDDTTPPGMVPKERKEQFLRMRATISTTLLHRGTETPLPFGYPHDYDGPWPFEHVSTRGANAVFFAVREHIEKHGFKNVLQAPNLPVGWYIFDAGSVLSNNVLHIFVETTDDDRRADPLDSPMTLFRREAEDSRARLATRFGSAKEGMATLFEYLRRLEAGEPLILDDERAMMERRAPRILERMVKDAKEREVEKAKWWKSQSSFLPPSAAPLPTPIPGPDAEVNIYIN